MAADNDKVPPATVEHYRRMQLLSISAIAMLQAAFKKALKAPTLEQAVTIWFTQLPEVTSALSELQEQAAWSGLFANAAALAQQGSYKTPSAWAVPGAFSGYSPVTGQNLGEQYARLGYRYLSQIAAGDLDAETAGRWMDTITQATISDAARDAVQADVITRPKIAFVRMLNPPSCELCIMLAGQIYWRDASFADRDRGGAFDRHDNCDCVHVPVDATISLAEHYANGLIDDPYEYFDSLDEATQNKIFSRGRAQAIRDGADIYAVTGSADYRGQSYKGEGYQRRTGLTTYSMSRLDANGNPTRLTPKGIYTQAGGDREEALRLLKEHGYIIDRRIISGTERARQVVQPWQPKNQGVSYGPGGWKAPESTYRDSDLFKALKEAEAKGKAQRANAQQIGEDETRARLREIGQQLGRQFGFLDN